MSTTEEATINPDGTQTVPGMEEDAGAGGGAEPGPEETAGAEDAGAEEEETFAEGMPEDVIKGTDPAIYLFLAVLILAGVWFFFSYKKKKDEEESDSFFADLDGEKFNLKLPAAVDEYYEIKEKCEDAGWEPGKPPPQGQTAANASGPHRVLAQALMKRCIADIPIVQHIQKESAGMNKLYSQSMCSVKQWKAYQAAEAMVSAEVDEVRAEADEIEPGWSQVIWRQAMQYHNMLKQKHEQEEKARKMQEDKKKLEESKVDVEQKKVDDAKAKEVAAEKAAQELLKAEEREKAGKKSFKDGSMKKGFLAGQSKKK